MTRDDRADAVAWSIYFCCVPRGSYDARPWVGLGMGSSGYPRLGKMLTGLWPLSTIDA